MEPTSLTEKDAITSDIVTSEAGACFGNEYIYLRNVLLPQKDARTLEACMQEKM